MCVCTHACHDPIITADYCAHWAPGVPVSPEGDSLPWEQKCTYETQGPGHLAGLWSALEAFKVMNRQKHRVSLCVKCRGKKGNPKEPYAGYTFKNDNDILIPAIRILPMGKGEFATYNDCIEFV